jgi:shikimate dehydrogenase
MTSDTHLNLQTDPSRYPGLDVYAVAGNPIAHSKSPTIHKHFAEQASQKIHYGFLQPGLDDFALAATQFFAAGGKGMNVTVPFKLDAKSFAESLTPRAQLAGAVNTLAIQHGKIIGDNTDGTGLVRDLLAQGAHIKNSRILLLGAGGAARGVLAPLLEQAPKQLTIANRTKVKADELVPQFSSLARLNDVAFGTLAFSDLENLVQDTPPYDLIINATAAGLVDQSPLSSVAAVNIFTAHSFAYDMVYGKTTAFMQQALQAGAQVSDGLGMLVEQAADAFLIWRGTECANSIDPRAVLAELRSAT